jgi:hypothetical protein
MRALRGQRLETQLDLTQRAENLLGLAEAPDKTQKRMRIKEMAAVVLQLGLMLGEGHFESPMTVLNLLLEGPAGMVRRANCKEHPMRRLIAQSTIGLKGKLQA